MTWLYIIFSVVVLVPSGLQIFKEKRRLLRVLWIVVFFAVIGLDVIGYLGSNQLTTLEGKSANLETEFSALPRPRELSDLQKNALEKKLSENPMRVGFITEFQDSEATQYAKQLTQIFLAAGWNVISPNNSSLLDNFDGKINIFTTGSELASGIEENFNLPFLAFDQANLSYESIAPRDGSFVGSLQASTLYVEIGSQ